MEYSKARILFVIDGCLYCRKYKEFIERLNLNLPTEKSISVIDCTIFEETGITTDPRIRKFSKYIGAGYPVLFFDGDRIDGANSREEAEAWLRARLHKDFIIREGNPNMFNKECKYISNGLFAGKIHCE